MKNINKEVWRYLDNQLTIKKNLLEGIINVRALAKKIISELKLTGSLNAVISSIRRYSGEIEGKENIIEKYNALKEAKLSTKTKLASVLLKKNETTRKKLAELYTSIDFQSGDILRIFEVSKYIKIIIDESTLEAVKGIFSQKEIVSIEKRIGELSIAYTRDVTRVPGVFALLSNEMAANNISIIDSMICHNEHIIIVEEKEIQRAFNVIFGLLHKK
ncbi:MAG TPA: hypothetical protein HA362_05945 [Nanoarchaeota archaeon]|nr:hypothetical protein [Nanoarchaeota archaeon]